MLLDVNKLIAFVNGVVPAGLKESVEKASAEAQERIAQLEARVSAEM